MAVQNLKNLKLENWFVMLQIKNTFFSLKFRRRDKWPVSIIGGQIPNRGHKVFFGFRKSPIQVKIGGNRIFRNRHGKLCLMKEFTDHNRSVPKSLRLRLTIFQNIWSNHCPMNKNDDYLQKVSKTLYLCQTVETFCWKGLQGQYSEFEPDCLTLGELSFCSIFNFQSRLEIMHL